MRTTALIALCLFVGAPAAGQVCERDELQSELQYLRRLSLDLRGRLPDYEELASVVTNRAVDPAIVTSMLTSPAFVERIRAHHQDLLWTNLDDLRIAQVNWVLRTTGRGEALRLWVPARAIAYRGAQVPCEDAPARFAADGALLTTEDPEDPRIRREGWVEIRPYWDPETTVRVCGFDAQDSLQAMNPRGGGVADCRRQSAPGCGCGPQLAWCQAVPVGTSFAITDAMREQLLRYVDALITEDRPYTDIVLGKDIELNGPLSHWLRNQSQTGGQALVASPEQNHAVPEIPFTAAEQWQRLERGSRHAGVLTMPGYLLEFASNRGRANRFYNAFLCQDFASDEPIPPSTDECHAEPDLTKRCGCKGCHLAVEPAAAHWGRWAQAGLLPMNEDLFPKDNPTCATERGERNPLCRLFYFTPEDVTRPEDEGWLGRLEAYVYADAAREANIEAGPEALARAAVQSGAFARCTVERMWKLFMARAPAPAEAEQIEALAEDFAADGYRLTPLVQSIVTRPEYVEAGLLSEDD